MSVGGVPSNKLVSLLPHNTPLFFNSPCGIYTESRGCGGSSMHCLGINSVDVPTGATGFNKYLWLLALNLGKTNDR
jgi:hypothetical protein